ncbi:MAG TPA: hypothetical protein DIW47_09915 [Bacteroidetes bacterium]|nr:hypothetical protein [Bacteroidota bacterium]
MNFVFAIFMALFYSCEKVTTQQDDPSVTAETGIDGQNMAFIDQLYQGHDEAPPEPVDLNELIVQLEKVKLIEKKTVSEIPNLFLSFLQNRETNFSMADPGEEWYSGCAGFTPINFNENTTEYQPTSQLVYFGMYEDIALMAYYTGTIGQHESIVIFKYSDTEITDYWEGKFLRNATNEETILALLKETGDKNSAFVPEYIWCSY